MKTELIHSQENSKYEKCYLKTDEIKAQNNAFNDNEIKLSISISDDLKTNEKWVIVANGVNQYHNLIGISYMPYFKIEIEDDHPLLWDYNYNRIETELSGIENLAPTVQNEMIAEIAKVYLEDLGGFIKFETNPISTPLKNSKGEKLFITNQKLYNLIEPILLKHGISINQIDIKPKTQKRRANKSKAKVLLFRNPFVTSRKSIKGHSYIIAAEFMIEQKTKV